ncbi:MAG: hypothetical protein IPQ17_06855 [Xanthomonadales bacterium]|nr:hypothetical protein [Xanthomonadales bacterium]
MKAAILIPVLTSKDAVGADALAMARILDELGIETRVFCQSSSGVQRRTWPAEEMMAFAGGPEDLVIYHFSIGWPAAIEQLRKCRGFRIVKYHNITPPRFFEATQANIGRLRAWARRDCRSGDAWLRSLPGRVGLQPARIE